MFSTPFHENEFVVNFQFLLAFYVAAKEIMGMDLFPKRRCGKLKTQKLD